MEGVLGLGAGGDLLGRADEGLVSFAHLTTGVVLVVPALATIAPIYCTLLHPPLASLFGHNFQLNNEPTFH